MLADWLLMGARGATIGAAASAGAASSSTLTISKPASGTAGTLLVAFIVNSLSSAPTAPAGWTKIGDGGRRSVFYRIADGSEGNDFTWTYPTATNSHGFIVPVGGGQIDTLGSFGSSATLPSAPSVNATVAKSIAFAFFSQWSEASVAFSTPGGWTALIADSNSTFPSGALFYKSVDAGPTGIVASTPTPSASSQGVQLVVKPR